MRSNAFEPKKKLRDRLLIVIDLKHLPLEESIKRLSWLSKEKIKNIVNLREGFKDTKNNTGSASSPEPPGKIKTLEVNGIPVSTFNAPTIDKFLYVDLKGKRPLSVYVRVGESSRLLVGKDGENLQGSSGAPYCQL
ncbi:hypothetical protein [Pyrococcus horikoshii]|uniref:hypothetical protein n=1 Tax=Pyrococcus horikoshii TaxID=53953 RepID=UPI00001B5671|nr:hypothetical protein [Pyrococcus horikoshii]